MPPFSSHLMTLTMHSRARYTYSVYMFHYILLFILDKKHCARPLFLNGHWSIIILNWFSWVIDSPLPWEMTIHFLFLDIKFLLIFFNLNFYLHLTCVFFVLRLVMFHFNKTIIMWSHLNFIRVMRNVIYENPFNCSRFLLLWKKKLFCPLLYTYFSIQFTECYSRQLHR